MSHDVGPNFAALDEAAQSRILTAIRDCRWHRCPSNPEDVARDVLATQTRQPRRLPSSVWDPPAPLLSAH